MNLNELFRQESPPSGDLKFLHRERSLNYLMADLATLQFNLWFHSKTVTIYKTGKNRRLRVKKQVLLKYVPALDHLLSWF